MSLTSAIVEALAKELGKLPVAALELVVDLVRGALRSEDPERYLKRRIVADGAHAAAQAALDELLDEKVPDTQPAGAEPPSKPRA